MQQNKNKFKLKFQQQTCKSKVSSACQRAINVCLLVSSLILINACTTAPKDYSKVKQGQWETRTLIKDTLNSKTYVAVMNIYALRDRSLRIDLVSPIGDHMGSLMINNGQLALLNVGTRTYYTGRAKPGALSSLFSLPVNPLHFQNVVFESPIKEKGWSCIVDKSVLKSCIDKNSKLQIEWDTRADGKRTVMISHSSGSMQINFKKFDDKIDENIKFSMKVPKSYKKVKL